MNKEQKIKYNRLSIIEACETVKKNINNIINDTDDELKDLQITISMSDERYPFIRVIKNSTIYVPVTDEILDIFQI